MREIKDPGPFIARILERQRREKEAAATLADDVIARCVEDYPERAALYRSPEFRKILASIADDDSDKIHERLVTLLNVFLPYAPMAARQTANTRRIPQGAKDRAAKLIRKAAEEIAQGFDRPKWDIRLESPTSGPYSPHGIEQLARDGNLSFALQLIASAVEQANLDVSPIPGLNQDLVARRGPSLVEPERAVPGYLARNIFAVLPAGFDAPYAAISALLAHIGITADPHAVARYIKG